MAFKPDKIHYLLAMVFLLVLAGRLYYAFQTPYFSNSDDYFTARQVENIMGTGLPMIHDDLSYGGRTHLGTYVFYYILAFFNLFMPLELVGKIVVNIFASSLAIAVYLAANEISKSRGAALFSAFISGFIPVFFKATFNSLSIYSLVFPLLVFCAYCFLRIEDEGYIYLYLISLLLLTLLSPAVLLLIIGLVIYVFFVKLDRMQQKRAEFEAILFSIFFVVWFIFLIYKKAFLFHGYSVIWQNVPKEMLAAYFRDTTIIEAIYQIGMLPLLYGIYALLQHIHKPVYREISFLSAFSLSTVALLWLKLIDPSLGLIYLGIISVLLFAQFYKWSFDYWKQTRFARLRYLLFAPFIISFILASVLPSFAYAHSTVLSTMDDEDAAVYKAIRQNTEENATVLAPLSEGHLVTGIAGRKNVADNEFLLVKGAGERYADINSIYTAKFETEALKIIDKYGISYIMLTPYARNKYGIKGLDYTKDRRCFYLVYNGDVKVYKVICRLRDL